MSSGWLRGVAMAALAVIGLTTANCAVYEPAPAYPAYGYGYGPPPGYYYGGPAVNFGFFDDDGWHHHHHWR